MAMRRPRVRTAQKANGFQFPKGTIGFRPPSFLLLFFWVVDLTPFLPFSIFLDGGFVFEWLWFSFLLFSCVDRLIFVCKSSYPEGESAS